MAIRGIQFVTDAQGKRVAVQLDLNGWGELWEDIYDNIVANSRKDEPTVPLEWDHQIEGDILAGKLDPAGQRADDDFESGRCTTINETSRR